MAKFTRMARNFMGNVLMFIGIVVLLIGLLLFYIGAWFTGIPLKAEDSAADISAETLKSFYQKQMRRKQGDE